MDAYSQLRQQARAKRDADIRAARNEYEQVLRDLARISRTIAGKNALATPAVDRRLRRRKERGAPFGSLSLTEAAERVLLEVRPLRLTELTIEVQKRGCRADDSPHKVARALRSAFSYHCRRFIRDPSGRWSVAREA
jgi:hypothetical protein